MANVDRSPEHIPATDISRNVRISSSAPRNQADLLSIFAADRRSEFVATDPTLARLLGRPPTSVPGVRSWHRAA